jgi:hypothetical protein
LSVVHARNMCYGFKRPSLPLRGFLFAAPSPLLKGSREPDAGGAFLKIVVANGWS